VRIEFNTRKDDIDETSRKRSENDYRKPSIENDDTTDNSYENWKRENPGKTINEYYASRKY